jgi:site-specific DNA-methyltransferase (adenine-specific)
MIDRINEQPFCQTRVSGSTFVNADCFDVFPFIEDKSIDAIICDLPYGTTACKWDSTLPLDRLWNEYKRVLKPNGVILLTASQPFTTVLIGNDLKMFKYNLVWDKVAVTNPMLAKKQPMRCHEDVLIFYDKQPTYNPQMRVGVKWSRAGKKQHTTDTLGQSKLFNNGSDESEMKYPKSIITFSNADKTKNEHPTQKPIDLMEWLIKTYTNEGDMVLDNTMGSGTTNLACIKLNRKSIGIEKEKQYYDVAVRRASEYCH